MRGWLSKFLFVDEHAAPSEEDGQGHDLCPTRFVLGHSWSHPPLSLESADTNPALHGLLSRTLASSNCLL